MATTLQTSISTTSQYESFDLAGLRIGQILELQCGHNIHWYIGLMATSTCRTEAIKGVMIMTNSPNRGIRIACSPYEMTTGRRVQIGNQLAIGYGHTEVIRSFRVIEQSISP
jgi:hypothetical protein